MQSPSDRRTSTRAKVDLFINRFLDGHPYMCRMTDISSTGLRIVPLIEPRGRASSTDQADAKSRSRYVGLQFQLPGVDGVFTASGETVNGAAHGERGYGIRFTTLPPECASAIRRFLASN